MVRICLTCGDYFAGDAPPFCPADGTPLAELDPRADGWDEGARVVEEKTRSSLRRTRRLKLRRVLTTMMTMVVTTMIVLVIVANAVIYLRPEPEAPAVASTVKPSPTPAPARVLPSTPPQTAEPTLLLPLLPADIPTPTPDAAATPDPSRPSTPTPTPDDTSTPEETATPTPTPSFVEAPPRTPTPTPTPTPTITLTLTPPPPPPPTPTPAPKCTGDDKRPLRAEIIASSTAAWEQAVERDREEIVRAYARERGVRASVNPLGPVVYSVSFSKTCVPVYATAVYFWRVRWEGAPAPDRPNNNGEPRQPAAGGDRKLFRTLTFPCSGGAGGWRCR